MKLTGKTRAAVEREAAAKNLRDEERSLLAELTATSWYAERASDYRESGGLYGKPMPMEIAAARQAARDRISEIRAELAETR